MHGQNKQFKEFRWSNVIYKYTTSSGPRPPLQRDCKHAVRPGVQRKTIKREGAHEWHLPGDSTGGYSTGNTRQRSPSLTVHWGNKTTSDPPDTQYRTIRTKLFVIVTTDSTQIELALISFVLKNLIWRYPNDIS